MITARKQGLLIMLFLGVSTLTFGIIGYLKTPEVIDAIFVIVGLVLTSYTTFKLLKLTHVRSG